MNNNTTFLKSYEAAKYFRISTATLLNWCKEGYFPGAIKLPNGHIRIPLEEVEAMLSAKNSMPRRWDYQFKWEPDDRFKLERCPDWSTPGLSMSRQCEFSNAHKGPHAIFGKYPIYFNGDDIWSVAHLRRVES